MPNSRLFLSYARADDKPFVKRLYDDLTKAGYDVWWDMEKMPSRDLTFLQEIRDAITHVDRLLLIVGPKAIASDYVRAEWQYAESICLPIIPLLRLGDYTLIPSSIALLHCPDFRESRPYDDAFAELQRLLGHSPFAARYRVW